MVDGTGLTVSERIEKQADELQRLHGYSVDRAVEEVSRRLAEYGVPLDLHALESARLSLRNREQRSLEILQLYRGITAGTQRKWYYGPGPESRIWPAFREALDTPDKNWDIRKLDDLSTRVVSELGNPADREFHVKGLVVGYVQSGKTANMTATIAKAVDAGYRMVIVLAGLTDALRTQTQDRLDTDLCNLTPQLWNSWTTATRDFDAGALSSLPALDDQTHIAVVKKNSLVLKRILALLQRTDPAVLQRTPAILIDDECDQASINTDRYRKRMTAINRRIRQLLRAFPRISYIGYTATPFANVLIDPAESADGLEDLYPADFILALPRPDDYFGAERLFGRDLLAIDDEREYGDGLDMIRPVPDQEVTSLRPTGNDLSGWSFRVTESLSEAIRYWLMVTTVRVIRGQSSDHSTMLIHTSVRTDAHFAQQESVDHYLRDLGRRIADGDHALAEEMEALWRREQLAVPSAGWGHESPAFREIWDQLGGILETVETAVENSVADNRLDYRVIEAPGQPDRGRRYIVVGGTVLARGLTLYGLAVSFFLRTSSQYDTLMQMGRWFGYRRGFEDLPRIWMTDDMRLAFRNLATVEAEIREDIKVYERSPTITPRQFAVRIRQMPGMLITAKNKMLAAVEAKVSFDGRYLQTFYFHHRNEVWLAQNWTAAADLVDSARESGCKVEHRSSHVIYRNVPLSLLLRFLGKYKPHEEHADIDFEDRIPRYIQERNATTGGSLTRWTVTVVGKPGGRKSSRTLGHLGNVHMVNRSARSVMGEGEKSTADIGALLSLSDVIRDLAEVPPEQNWKAVIAARPSDQPLLLLYPINPHSTPDSRAHAERRELDAVTDVMGAAVIFPDVPVGFATAVKYVQAPIVQGELVEELPADDDE